MVQSLNFIILINILKLIIYFKLLSLIDLILKFFKFINLISIVNLTLNLNKFLINKL
jgi:hypothetical protein